MDKKKLHKIVCMMKAAAIEMMDEYNEASCRKTEWYDNWLEELRKGNVTDEWFNKNVRDQFCKLHMTAGDYIARLEDIADKLESVNGKLMEQKERIDGLFNETKGE